MDLHGVGPLTYGLFSAHTFCRTKAGVQWVGELWIWRKGCAVISELLSTCRSVALIHAIQGQLCVCVCVSIFFPHLSFTQMAA